MQNVVCACPVWKVQASSVVKLHPSNPLCELASNLNVYCLLCFISVYFKSGALRLATGGNSNVDTMVLPVNLYNKLSCYL
jgi:hypothetical protein